MSFLTEIKINPNRHRDLQPDYVTRLHMLGTLFTNYESQSQQGLAELHLGPCEWGETSLFEKVFFLCVFVLSHQPHSNKLVKFYHVLALDVDGHVIADRHNFFFEFADGLCTTEGSIHTGLRNRRMAHPLDRHFKRIVQQEATLRRMPACWKVTNGNLEDLIKAGEIYQRNPSQENQQNLARLTVEQERWLSLYGNGGKLGLVDSSITFQPGFGHDDLVPKLTDDEFLLIMKLIVAQLHQ